MRCFQFNSLVVIRRENTYC